MHLTPEKAIEELRQICEDAGGVKAFADSLGIHVSAVSKQLNGQRPIQGKVADYMNIKVSKQTIILGYTRRGS